MTRQESMDLVDSITEWIDRQDQADLVTDEEVNGVLGVQILLDAGPWGVRGLNGLTPVEVATIKAELTQHESAEFVDWVIDSTLEMHGYEELLGAEVPPEVITRLADEDSADYVDEPDDEPEITIWVAAAGDPDEDEPDNDEAEPEELDHEAEPEELDHEAEPEELDHEDEPDDDEAEPEELDHEAEPEELDHEAEPEELDHEVEPEELDHEAEPDDDEAEPEDEELKDPNESDGSGMARLDFFEGPDQLGPSFLDPVEPSTFTKIRPIAAWVLICAAFAAFVLAGIQLIQNIEREPQVAVDTEPDTETSETAEPEQSATAVATATPIPAASVAADSDEGVEPPEPTSIALLRTLDGHVYSIVLFEDSVEAARVVHDGEGDDAAQHVSLIQDGVAIIETDGDVHTARFRTNGRPRNSEQVWDGQDNPAAVAMVESLDQFLTLDATGSIHAFGSDEVGTEDSTETVWDAQAESVQATSLAAQMDLVPFVLADGSANMIVSSADNQVVGIWSVEAGEGSNASPPPPAFNLATSPSGILLGVGQGAVAKYKLGEFEGDRLAAVWVPDEERGMTGATSYSTAGRSVAIVTNVGDVVLVDDTGSGPHIWDHTESGVRALRVAATEDDMLILLESGTVLRIDGTGNSESLGSIWDVTDETLSPATQILLLER